MTLVKTAKKTTRGASSDNAKLSMRAAREAQNGLAVTLSNLNATADGLTELEAEGRLARGGHNEVAHDKPPHAIVQLLKALNNPFIYVLLTLAGISFFTDSSAHWPKPLSAHGCKPRSTAG